MTLPADPNFPEGLRVPKPYAGADLEEGRGLSKKDLELHLIDGLMDRLGFPSCEISLQERPDAFVEMRRGAERCLIGCELRTLQADEGARGSALRRFRERWISISSEAIALLAKEGGVVPYCVIDFLAPTYECLDGVRRDDLVADLVTAGKALVRASSIRLPRSGLPTLSRVVKRVRKIDSDGCGLLWWPTHVRSGLVPPDRGRHHARDRGQAACRPRLRLARCSGAVAAAGG